MTDKNQQIEVEGMKVLLASRGNFFPKPDIVRKLARKDISVDSCLSKETVLERFFPDGGEIPHYEALIVEAYIPETRNSGASENGEKYGLEAAEEIRRRGVMVPIVVINDRRTREGGVECDKGLYHLPQNRALEIVPYILEELGIA